MTTSDPSVTNIYSIKMSWLVARYLLETSQLTNGIQLKSSGDCYPELRAKGTELERMLRRDLPEMTGCLIQEYAVAITSTLSNAEVLNRLRLAEQPQAPARTVRIVPTLFTSLTVFPCGFGVISDYCGYQFFRHDLNLEEVKSEDTLRELFWERINHTLPDPFYDGAEPQPNPLATLRGTVEEMAETLDALGAALTHETYTKYFPQRSPLEYSIATARSKRSMTSVEYKGYSPANDLRMALAIISQHYHPVGTKISPKSSYHGHAGHKYCNFKVEPLHVKFTVLESPPARVRMAALGRIRRWFTEHAPGKLELINKLCGETTPIDEEPEEEEMPLIPTVMHTIMETAGGADHVSLR